MTTDQQLKELVKEKYSEIADQSYEQNATSCCGASCGCSTIDAALMAESYTDLKGYNADADLGLGCGLPTEFAQIKEGDTVVDLGSGAGNDAFVARAITGVTGKVIGVDMTEKMIQKAKVNAEKLGYTNVDFRLGDIEDMPLASKLADVVVSNCVLNLVPNKAKAFEETFRVLKPGGHFSVSDIVLEGALPENLKQAAEMYAGCVSGAIQKEAYIEIVKAAGFTNVSLQKEKDIIIPEEILKNYLSPDEIRKFRESKARIMSITLYAERPVQEKQKTCCGPECCN
jgi:arsenite methyltransferase